MGKDKKEKKEKKEESDGSGDEESEVVVGPYCLPLADSKLSKKLFKVIKKGAAPSHRRLVAIFAAVGGACILTKDWPGPQRRSRSKFYEG